MNADDTDIAQLVRAAQQGDELALARLLHAVRPRVYRWALVHTSSADDAEDIAQQTLLRVHRKLGDFAFGSLFTTWLHAVTRSVAADWHRTRSRRATLLHAHTPAATSSFQQRSDDTRLLGLVRDQLAGLPARQREAFDLIDLQGYTPAEAADLLGLNASTTRVHVLRARRAIRQRILAVHPAIVEELR